MTPTLATLDTTITSGNIAAIHRPARTDIAVRSSLDSANRRVSSGSRTNARTTRMPVICSRSTRLTSSSRSWTNRNAGIMLDTTTPMQTNSTGTTTTTSQESPKSSRIAITMPPTIMIGMVTAIRQVIIASICTCWTSFVARVISEGAPYVATSRLEKLPILWNTAARRSRPHAIAAWLPNHADDIEQAAWSRETASMIAPSRTM